MTSTLRFVAASALLAALAGCVTPTQPVSRSQQVTVESELLAEVSLQRNLLPSYASQPESFIGQSGFTPHVLTVPTDMSQAFDYDLVVTFPSTGFKFRQSLGVFWSHYRDSHQIRIPRPEFGPKPDRETVIAAVKRNLDSTLIDPTSPLFEWGELKQDVCTAANSPLVFCWTLHFRLNSKNRMGGYVGWQDCKAYFANGVLLDVIVPESR